MIGDESAIQDNDDKDEDDILHSLFGAKLPEINEEELRQTEEELRRQLLSLQCTVSSHTKTEYYEPINGFTSPKKVDIFENKLAPKDSYHAKFNAHKDLTMPTMPVLYSNIPDNIVRYQIKQKEEKGYLKKTFVKVKDDDCRIQISKSDESEDESSCDTDSRTPAPSVHLETLWVVTQIGEQKFTSGLGDAEPNPHHEKDILKLKIIKQRKKSQRSCISSIEESEESVCFKSVLNGNGSIKNTEEEKLKNSSSTTLNEKYIEDAVDNYTKRTSETCNDTERNKINSFSFQSEKQIEERVNKPAEKNKKVETNSKVEKVSSSNKLDKKNIDVKGDNRKRKTSKSFDDTEKRSFFPSQQEKKIEDRVDKSAVKDKKVETSRKVEESSFSTKLDNKYIHTGVDISQKKTSKTCDDTKGKKSYFFPLQQEKKIEERVNKPTEKDKKEERSYKEDKSSSSNKLDKKNIHVKGDNTMKKTSKSVDGTKEKKSNSFVMEHEKKIEKKVDKPAEKQKQAETNSKVEKSSSLTKFDKKNIDFEVDNNKKKSSKSCDDSREKKSNSSVMEQEKKVDKPAEKHKKVKTNSKVEKSSSLTKLDKKNIGFEVDNKKKKSSKSCDDSREKKSNSCVMEQEKKVDKPAEKHKKVETNSKLEKSSSLSKLYKKNTSKSCDDIKEKKSISFPSQQEKKIEDRVDKSAVKDKKVETSHKEDESSSSNKLDKKNIDVKVDNNKKKTSKTCDDTEEKKNISSSSNQENKESWLVKSYLSIPDEEIDKILDEQNEKGRKKLKDNNEHIPPTKLDKKRIDFQVVNNKIEQKISSTTELNKNSHDFQTDSMSIKLFTVSQEKKAQEEEVLTVKVSCVEEPMVDTLECELENITSESKELVSQCKEPKNKENSVPTKPPPDKVSQEKKAQEEEVLIVKVPCVEEPVVDTLECELENITSESKELVSQCKEPKNKENSVPTKPPPDCHKINQENSCSDNTNNKEKNLKKPLENDSVSESRKRTYIEMNGDGNEIEMEQQQCVLYEESDSEVLKEVMEKKVTTDYSDITTASFETNDAETMVQRQSYDPHFVATMDRNWNRLCDALDFSKLQKRKECDHQAIEEVVEELVGRVSSEQETTTSFAQRLQNTSWLQKRKLEPDKNFPDRTGPKKRRKLASKVLTRLYYPTYASFGRLKEDPYGK